MPGLIAPATYALASRTASTSNAPFASCAAIAAAKVQPVPCVLRPSMRGPTNSVNTAVLEKQVHDFRSRQVAALDHHGAGLEHRDSARRFTHIVARCDRHLGQDLGFGDVRRDDARQAQQRPTQRVHRFFVQQVIAALGHHHRIDNQVGELERFDGRRDRLDDLRRLPACRS